MHIRYRRLPVLAAAAAFMTGHAGLVAAQESATLDEPQATYEEPFSLISGLRELADGRLLVSDALEESLYALDADLTESVRLARNGQGPDEYRQPDALFEWPGDSTLMTDLGNGRLTVIGPDYHFVRAIPVVQASARGLRILLPEGVDGSGAVYYQPRGDGTIRDSAEVVRWVPTAVGGPAPVAHIKLPEVTERTSGGAGNMRQEVTPVPLSSEDGWAAGTDGSVAVVRAGDYHVDWIGPDGEVVAGPPVDWEPVPVVEADKQAWVEAAASEGVMMSVTNVNGEVSASMRRGGGRGAPSTDRFDWPETKPPFDAGTVRVTPDGSLWVGRFVAAGERPRIDVFDRAGRPVGTVLLPAGREVVGFGEGSVYLARPDDLGFEWLERYERPRF